MQSIKIGKIMSSFGEDAVKNVRNDYPVKDYSDKSDNESPTIEEWLKRVITLRTCRETFVTRPIQVKIAVVGDSGVGKTCLVKTFTSRNKSIDNYTTVGYDLYTREIHVDFERVKLNIWEPSGQERFCDAIPRQCLRDCHGVIFCYDPTHYRSLVHVAQVWKELVSRRVRLENCVKILVECKNDLHGCQCAIRGPFCRSITDSEKEVALDMLGLEMFSTSVVTSNQDQLEAPFRYLARTILHDVKLLDEIKELEGEKEDKNKTLILEEPVKTVKFFEPEDEIIEKPEKVAIFEDLNEKIVSFEDEIIPDDDPDVTVEIDESEIIEENFQMTTVEKTTNAPISTNGTTKSAVKTTNGTTKSSLKTTNGTTKSSLKTTNGTSQSAVASPVRKKSVGAVAATNGNTTSAQTEKVTKVGWWEQLNKLC